ncbi:lactate 2-monooxygenase [Filibacter tadaridae]|uniref:L-lactate oxidase n=1 Tax=Filibacter tadaridae TaxID=2483811 RepID=A0A3P5XHG1_9BACL|nr:lactate 2-monooxygenase [Filibacter tadaridae]VDC28141.1 Lactate 2-monooxygenase [Filibacter tadaridae]
MTNIGNQIQFGVYQTMPNPDPNRLPIAFEEWEERAREVLEDGPYYYVAGGAGGENTMKANLHAFNRWKIVPRMLRNVENRDTSVELFGKNYNFPLMHAPIGVQSIIHEEGDLGSARACAELGVPFIASSASTVPMEKIAEVMGDAPRWFQLYWSKDPDIAASFLRRAEASGYSAIIVTLDTPMMAWREHDLRNVYLPFLIGEGVGNYLTDPAFCSKLEKSPQEDPNAAIMYWTQVFGNASLTWDDLAFLRKHTKLPIVLKGILHPDDAKLAIEHGVDGIIVSNHGGRQVDGAIGALDALPLVCDAVQGQIPVLMDSGIRRGSDVIKALALGAKAVLVGRPCMYGLAVAGEKGVKAVLQNMIADMDITMALAGERSVNELGKSILVNEKF